MNEEKGWLDPWGKQHELFCKQYMADEAVMGRCTCSIIRTSLATQRAELLEKVQKLETRRTDQVMMPKNEMVEVTPISKWSSLVSKSEVLAIIEGGEMTDSLKALIEDELLTLNRCLGTGGNLRVTDALLAVLEIEPISESLRSTDYEMGFADGYNKALADVKQAIEKELG